MGSWSKSQFLWAGNEATPPSFPAATPIYTGMPVSSQAKPTKFPVPFTVFIPRQANKVVAKRGALHNTSPDKDMEDLAASLMPYPHSAPLYLLYDGASIANASHGLAAPPLPLLGDDDDDDDGFAFATTTTTLHGGGAAALRACASDVSAAAYADELFRAGALLPLSLPPRLQRPAYSAGASAATSPTSSAAALQASCRKHRGFDPFAAALEKVRRDGGAAPVTVRRARSLSPLRGAASAAAITGSAHAKNSGGDTRAAARRVRKGKGRGVRHMLCRVLMASAAAAPKALWPRRKDGVSYRPGLLVCLGYGV